MTPKTSYEIKELSDAFVTLHRALSLTERNLTSLIDASRPNAVALSHWRDEVRAALAKVSVE